MLTWCYTSYGQLESPIPVTKTTKDNTVCNVCPTAKLSLDVHKYTDLEPQDACYQAVQSLEERYGVNVVPCSPTTYDSKAIMTNAMLVQMMYTSCVILTDLQKMVIEEKLKKGTRISKEKSELGSYDPNDHMAYADNQYDDTKATDCYEKNAEDLGNEYNINIGDANNNLNATKPIDVVKTLEMLAALFNKTAYKAPAYTKKTMTKGAFAILLNNYLDSYNELLGKL